MVVVDTNIICYFFLTGVHTAQATQAYRKDPIWIAPKLWTSEFRSVLASYVQKGLISLVDAGMVMNEALLAFEGHEYDVLSMDVLELAFVSGCTAYDCEYVALAQEMGLLLLTADQQLLDRFPLNTVSLNTFIQENE